MKLRSLSLHAFGAVRERTLEFAVTRPVLNLVYGANEAGKSTTLRAMTALFYGVPDQTTDARVFDSASLRIAATLVDAQGNELQIVRRKGRKNTLALADGTLLDESALGRMLQGIPAHVFRNMFGLDQPALREGGEQLRLGKGDLGESLFQASTGGPSIRRALASLEQEADQLWKPRGKQEIRLALDRYKAVHAELKAANKGAEAVRVQQRGLDELREQIGKLAAEQEALRVEQSRLKRALEVLPQLARRRALEQERAALGNVVLLVQNAGARRELSQAALQRCDEELARNSAKRAKLSARRAQLHDPEGLGAVRPEEIERVREGLVHFRKAARELPQRRAELELATREIERARASLAAPAKNKQMSLVLAVPPSPEAVATFRSRYDAHKAAVDRDEQDTRTLHEREEQTLQEIETIEREGAPPTEAELVTARAARDALWPPLRESIAAGAGAPEETLDALAAIARAEQRVDELSDRMRREAKRVSELARLLSVKSRIERERVQLDATRVERRKALAEIDTAWRALWAPLGVLPASPGEMQAWLAQLTGHLDARERSSSAIGALERDCRLFEEDVRSLLHRNGLSALLELSTERAAEELARTYDAARRAAGEREHLDRDLRDSEDEQVEIDARATAAQRTLAELLAAAQATDVAGLLLAEQRSQRARAIDQELEQLGQRAWVGAEGVGAEGLGGEGADLEALSSELMDHGVDRLHARIEQVNEELVRVHEEHTNAVRDLGATERGLLQMAQGQLAADRAVELEHELRGLRELVMRYARVRLAADLLKLVVQRHREQHQAPMVQHASALFARLTLGRYPRLEVSYDAQDEPTLVCVDDSGRNVPVETLSDGARDQLYLALRLASLTRFAERAEPLPLVLDDVLVHFDDERVAAALQVLAEAAETLQVIFFTHHARVVELARSVLPRERLVVHELDQSSTRNPTLGSTIAG